MTRSAGPLLPAATIFAALALVGALALRRAELAVLAAPFALLAGLGLLGGRPDVRAWLDLPRPEALEGDELEALFGSHRVRGPSSSDRRRRCQPRP